MLTASLQSACCQAPIRTVRFQQIKTCVTCVRPQFWLTVSASRVRTVRKLVIGQVVDSSQGSAFKGSPTSINYDKVLEDLYVGSCLKTPRDVDLVREELGVGSVICLQDDNDLLELDLDLDDIRKHCATRGDITHYRLAISHVDASDLVRRLPDVVPAVQEAAASGRGPVYIHCVGGRGRAPTVALAWLYWCKALELQDALQILTSHRVCQPNVSAVREATWAMLYGDASTGAGESKGVESARERLLSDEGSLTPAERERIHAIMGM